MVHRLLSYQPFLNGRMSTYALSTWEEVFKYSGASQDEEELEDAMKIKLQNYLKEKRGNITTDYLKFWKSNTLLGIIMAGKKLRFWPKSAIFSQVNNFPCHNKNPPTQLFGFLGGMAHNTLHVSFNISNKHI